MKQIYNFHFPSASVTQVEVGCQKLYIEQLDNETYKIIFTSSDGIYTRIMPSYYEVRAIFNGCLTVNPTYKFNFIRGFWLLLNRQRHIYAELTELTQIDEFDYENS